jgi:Protein of unknown function (DUF3551)
MDFGKSNRNSKETSMRRLVIVLLFIAAALLGEGTAASAQSGRSYAFCAIYYGIDADGTPSCAFDTRAQCMETISGIGGFCIENEHYHAATVPQRHRVHVLRRGRQRPG